MSIFRNNKSKLSVGRNDNLDLGNEKNKKNINKTTIKNSSLQKNTTQKKINIDDSKKIQLTKTITNNYCDSIKQKENKLNNYYFEIIIAIENIERKILKITNIIKKCTICIKNLSDQIFEIEMEEKKLFSKCKSKNYILEQLSPIWSEKSQEKKIIMIKEIRTKIINFVSGFFNPCLEHLDLVVELNLIRESKMYYEKIFNSLFQ